MKTKNMTTKSLKDRAGVVLLGAALLMTACEAEVIDLAPVTSLTDATAYSTAERCEASVIGAYDAAQCGVYHGGTSYTRGYPFGTASILQGEMRGADMVNNAAFYDFTYSSTYTTTTANNATFWEASFECINRVNVVLEGIAAAAESGVITEEQGKDYRAELLFLRAMTYHMLLLHFSMPVNVSLNNNYGLPLYTKAINTKESLDESLTIGRSSVQETYAQVLADLDEAESLFTTSERNSVNGITRASKGCVIALKTRVYLHQRKWDKVVEEAKKIVEENGGEFTSSIGDYALTPNPSDPFTSYKNNTESIFSIENSSTDNSSVNGAMASMMAAHSGGRALVSFSPLLYNDVTYWYRDDKRREMLYYYSADKSYYCNKYTLVTTREEYAPLLRYAEVLLNYAEAELRSGGDRTLALRLLNAVRSRATQPYTAAFTTDEDFLKALLYERRIEFFGEGRRWEDIHRLAAESDFPACATNGIPRKIDYSKSKDVGAFVHGQSVDAYYKSQDAIPYTDKRFLWPIPVDDIVRNPTLAAQQNAGW